MELLVRGHTLGSTVPKWPLPPNCFSTKLAGGAGDTSAEVGRDKVTPVVTYEKGLSWDGGPLQGQEGRCHPEQTLDSIEEELSVSQSCPPSVGFWMNLSPRCETHALVVKQEQSPLFLDGFDEDLPTY